MDPYEFILIVFRSLSLLCIFIGSVLILLSFADVTGLKLGFFQIEHFKLASRKINEFRAVGLAIFLLGCLICFLPATVTIEGTVMDGKVPANGALVSINGETKMVFDGGSFLFSDIPKNASYIEYTYRGINHKEILKIPFYWAIFNYNTNYEFKFPKMTIEGQVTNELGRAVPSGIQVCIVSINGSQNGDGPKYTNNYGQYNFSNISCENPIKISVNQMEWDPLTSKFIPKYLNQIIVPFDDADINAKYKKIDICTQKALNLRGTVKYYCGGLDENPIPVIGALIILGSRSNITNNDGTYLIKNVPIGTTEYKIKPISGNWWNDTIVPSFKDEVVLEDGFGPREMITRDIYIC
jgi:hypothetical protein